MGGFFRGWRRKVGALTLVLACLFMAGWVRSFSQIDVVAHRQVSVQSSQGRLQWARRIPVHPDDGGYAYTVASHPIPKGCIDLLDDPDKKWQLRLFGFGIGTYHENRLIPHSIWVMPYWSIVLPLTLISFWLLLSKPRKSTSKKAVEPIPVDGGCIMREFFRGWRRKLGVVTLLLASVTMGLWVRGHCVTDLYQFGSGHGTTFHTLVLSQHGIHVPSRAWLFTFD